MRRFFPLFVLALWLGSAAFLIFVAAPAAFAVAPDRQTAGNVVGEMLRKWHYLSLAAPALLLIFDWRAGFRSNVRLALLASAIVLATLQGMADLRIRAIRSDSLIAIQDLPKGDPVRRQFGQLHGASTILMLLQGLVAAGVLVTIAREEVVSDGRLQSAAKPE